MRIKILLVLFVVFFNVAISAQTSVQKDFETQWKESVAYQKFLQLQSQGKDKEAEQLRVATCDKMADEILKQYIQDFKAKFQERMQGKVAALPLGLKTVLADAYIQGKNLLSPEHKNPKYLNKFVSGLYWYIDSIYHSKMITEKKAYMLQKKFPELKGTKYMNLLLELGRNFDTIQKNKIEIQKSNIGIKQWDEIIRKLQAL